MILFFHFICIIARFIASNISKSFNKGKLLWVDGTSDTFSEDQTYDCRKEITGHDKYPIYENDTLKFFPPVYVQRYETVALILKEVARESKIRKVVDFGCSELGFLVYLKNIEGITEILEVDIDSEILERHSNKAAPLTSDYLMGKWKKPLDVYILSGSIAEFDEHLIGCDALVGIELIEHLTNEDLDKMPHNVFFRIKPKIVIFTTPNAEFNCLFPNFKYLRHEDHKFEWTRKEFYDWTQKILKCYPEYSVKFYGIGAGPEGTENLGCCTQMAVFNRSDDAELFLNMSEEFKDIHNYKLIQHYKYPVYTDNRTLEERIIHEIQFQAFYFSNLDTYYNYDTGESEIPLHLLKEFVSDLCSDDELLNILKKSGMTLKQKNDSWILVYPEVEGSESDITNHNSDGLNDDISEIFYDNRDMILAHRNSWNNELCLEDTPIFGSLRESVAKNTLLESNLSDTKNFFNNGSHLDTDKTNEKIKSTTYSCNYLNKKSRIKNGNVKNFENKNNETIKPVKSRIPRMKGERYDNFSGRNLKETDYKFKKLSKSCSLDSCLENVNSKLYENSSCYLNLIPGHFSSTNKVSALSTKKKHMKNISSSSLFSSSLESGSGYPFSTPPDDNLIWTH